MTGSEDKRKIEEERGGAKENEQENIEEEGGGCQEWLVNIHLLSYSFIRQGEERKKTEGISF